MEEEKNLLLAIHFEDKKEDIYVTKERKALTVIDKEKNSSFIVPQYKVDNLELLFSNVLDPNENNENYAVYYKHDGIVRENDFNKVQVIKDIITRVKWDEFLNEYPHLTVDSDLLADLVDKYDCVFPLELEQILTYSNEGIIFYEDHHAKLFSNDERLSSRHYKDEELLLPIAEIKDEVICYDCSQKLYYVLNSNGEVLRENIEFREVWQKTTDEIDESISNIDYQLEKLSIGNLKKKDAEEKALEQEVVTQVIEVEGTPVKVTQHEKIEFDLAGIVDLIDEKIDEVIAKAKKQEELANLSKVKTKLDLMIERNEAGKAKISKAKEKEKKTYPRDIFRAVTRSFDNFNLRLNDTSKLVVYHLPYHEYSGDLEIVEVPVPVYEYYNLIVGETISLGKMKFLVKEVTAKKAKLELLATATILDENSKVLKEGSIVEFEFDKKKKYRLRKNKAMETWTIHVEKATFELELRNVEYARLMKALRETENYKKYGEIEKLETKISVMLFLKFVMDNQDFGALAELYEIISNKVKLYEEYITDYNIKNASEEKDQLASFTDKEKFVDKMNFVKGLVASNWLDYPRYIFGQHRFFERDELMIEFISYRNDLLTENALKDYALDLFKKNSIFKELDEEGKEHLDACLSYLSSVYKYNPVYGETIKYAIEKYVITDESEEDIALLLAKLCRKGIVDYNDFKDYEYQIQELYRKGELKYPIFSELFVVGEVRGGIQDGNSIL